MTFTRNQYRTVAEAVKDTLEFTEKLRDLKVITVEEAVERDLAVSYLTDHLIESFKDDNPNFNEYIFKSVVYDNYGGNKEIVAAPWIHV